MPSFSRKLVPALSALAVALTLAGCRKRGKELPAKDDDASESGGKGEKGGEGGGPKLMAYDYTLRISAGPESGTYSDSQTNPGTEPFVLYRFAKQSEIPNTSDPDNPTNLQVWAPSTRRRIINFDNPSAESNVLQFEIFTDQIADSDAAAQQLNTLLINILPMSRLANASAGDRIIDALGDTRSAQLNEFLQVDLRANRVYQDTSDFEPEGESSLPPQPASSAAESSRQTGAARRSACMNPHLPRRSAVKRPVGCPHAADRRRHRTGAARRRRPR